MFSGKGQIELRFYGYSVCPFTLRRSQGVGSGAVKNAPGFTAEGVQGIFT